MTALKPVAGIEKRKIAYINYFQWSIWIKCKIVFVLIGKYYGKHFFLNTYEQITSEPNYVEMQKNEQKKADDVNSKINTQ